MVMSPFSLDDESVALLYLVNLTAGLLDGDAHRIEITARAGTQAVVTGQSASRIHPALNSYATQQWAIDVDQEACLVVLPGPAIPYRGCRFLQHARVEVAPGGRLIWGDIWLPGRYDRGALSERFQFDRIVQDFEVRREGKLVYRDRYRWDGPWTEEDVRWYWGGELACGSLVMVGPEFEALGESLPKAEGAVRRSLFQLDTGAVCLRWCGNPTAVTIDLVRVALSLAARFRGGPAACPWLLGSHALAPNHWFSIPGG
jgi:urease accessory protein